MERIVLFPTPVAVFDLADSGELNRQLTEALLAERQTSPGFQASNVGGWHSVPDLSQREQPCFRTLMEHVVGRVGELVGSLAESQEQRVLPFRFGVQAWAMIMEAGDYTILHDHGNAHWSTVYYVDAGDPDPSHAQSGELAFVDPRRGGRPIPALEFFSPTFTVTPRTGALVVFPAYLQHYVHAYRGSRPRISVSANLVMDVISPDPR